MTGLIISACLLFGIIAALCAVIELLLQTSLRKRPNVKNDPPVLGGEFNSGRGGHSIVWFVPRDDQELCKNLV